MKHLWIVLIFISTAGYCQLTVKMAQDSAVDLAYHYWEGWLSSKGTLTQKSGAVIDWSNKEWEKKFNPD